MLFLLSDRNPSTGFGERQYRSALRLCAAVMLSLCLAGGAYAQAPASPAPEQVPEPSVCERTEQVRDAIVDAVDGVSDCAGVTAVHLAEIMELDLSDQDIEELQVGDFNGIYSTAAITIEGNPFSEGLSLEVVNDLKLLVEEGATISTDFLRVQGVLPTRLGLVLGEMEDLDLEDAFILFSSGSYNPAARYEITVTDLAVTMATDVMNHRTTITGVADGQTEIQITGIYDGNSAIHTLEVSVCDRTPQVCTLINTADGGVESIAAIDLSDSDLSELGEDDFSGLTGLITLDISNNPLEILPLGIFTDTVNLEALNMSDTSIKRLPNGIFDGLALASFNTGNEIIAIDGVLPEEIMLTGEAPNQRFDDLHNAFVRGNGSSGIQPAESYELIFNPSVVTMSAEITAGTPETHELTIVAVDDGEIEVTVEGVSGSSREQHTITIVVDGVSPPGFRVSKPEIELTEGESSTIVVRFSGLESSETVTINIDRRGLGSEFTTISSTQWEFTEDGEMELIVTAVDDKFYTGSPKTASLYLTAEFNVGNEYAPLEVPVQIEEDEILRIAGVVIEALTEGVDMEEVITLMAETNEEYLVTVNYDFPLMSQAQKDIIGASLSGNIKALSTHQNGDDQFTVVKAEEHAKYTKYANNPSDPFRTFILTMPVLSDPSANYLNLRTEVQISLLSTGEAESREFTAVYPISYEHMSAEDDGNIPDAIEVSGGRLALGEYALLQYAADPSADYQVRIDNERVDIETIGIEGLPDDYAGEGIYDFAVYLNQDETVARMAIYLEMPLSADKRLVKYADPSRDQDDDGAWEEFEVNAGTGDAYFSADVTAENECTPEVQATADLTGRHQCVILHISDGGPNDADGEPNGIASSLVAPGNARLGGSESRPSGGGGGGGGGGGSADLWLLLLLASMLLVTRTLTTRGRRSAP